MALGYGSMGNNVKVGGKGKKSKNSFLIPPKSVKKGGGGNKGTNKKG